MAHGFLETLETKLSVKTSKYILMIPTIERKNFGLISRFTVLNVPLFKLTLKIGFGFLIKNVNKSKKNLIRISLENKTV